MFLETLDKKDRVDYLVSPKLLQYCMEAENNPNFKEGIGGVYFPDDHLIIVKDEDNVESLLHETSHYLSTIGDPTYWEIRKEIITWFKDEGLYEELLQIPKQEGYPDDMLEEELIADCFEMGNKNWLCHPLFKQVLDGKVDFNKEDCMSPTCFYKVHEIFPELDWHWLYYGV